EAVSAQVARLTGAVAILDLGEGAAAGFQAGWNVLGVVKMQLDKLDQDILAPHRIRIFLHQAVPGHQRHDPVLQAEMRLTELEECVIGPLVAGQPGPKRTEDLDSVFVLLELDQAVAGPEPCLRHARIRRMLVYERPIPLGRLSPMPLVSQRGDLVQRTCRLPGLGTRWPVCPSRRRRRLSTTLGGLLTYRSP